MCAAVLPSVRQYLGALPPFQATVAAASAHRVVFSNFSQLATGGGPEDAGAAGGAGNGTAAAPEGAGTGKQAQGQGQQVQEQVQLTNTTLVSTEDDTDTYLAQLKAMGWVRPPQKCGGNSRSAGGSGDGSSNSSADGSNATSALALSVPSLQAGENGSLAAPQWVIDVARVSSMQAALRAAAAYTRLQAMGAAAAQGNSSAGAGTGTGTGLKAAEPLPVPSLLFLVNASLGHITGLGSATGQAAAAAAASLGTTLGAAGAAAAGGLSPGDTAPLVLHSHLLMSGPLDGPASASASKPGPPVGLDLGSRSGLVLLLPGAQLFITRMVRSAHERGRRGMFARAFLV